MSKPAGGPDEAGGAVPAADYGAQVGSQIMLAEYSALHAEVERRANVQWGVFALQISSAGVISSLVISHVSDIALLLVVPLSSYMFGSRYILHDYHIRLISRYFRESLSGRLGKQLEWEAWEKDKMGADDKRSRWSTPTDWDMRHPTRLAFEGVASLALLVAALAAVYTWRDKVPQWYLTLGFALLWALGALATYSLHSSFEWCSTTSKQVTG